MRPRISLAALAAAFAAFGLIGEAVAAPGGCWPTVAPSLRRRQLAGHVDFGDLAAEGPYADRDVAAPQPVTTVSAGTPVVAACATLAVSTEGRCGRFNGGARCPDNKCCSQWGYCQDDGGDSGEAWCGAGCQIGYGKCHIPANRRRLPDSVCPTASGPAPYTLTTVSKSVPVYMACPTLDVTTDGRCGVQSGGKKCPEGLCCSEWGWCQDDGDDSGIPWCGGGCQLGYGKCFVGCRPVSTSFTCPTAPPSAPTREAEVDGTEPTHTLTRVSRGTPVYNACTRIPISDNYKCGTNVGKRCPPGLCCSQWGVCQDDGGNSGEPWCGTGCQLGYGKCFVGSGPVQESFTCPDTAPEVTTTTTRTRMTRTTLTWSRTTVTGMRASVSAGTPVYLACQNYEVSVDGCCGTKNGKRCRRGVCCSEAGFCQDDGGNSGEAWCGAGCQLGYGKCFVSAQPSATYGCGYPDATPTPTPVVPCAGSGGTGFAWSPGQPYSPSDATRWGIIIGPIQPGNYSSLFAVGASAFARGDNSTCARPGTGAAAGGKNCGELMASAYIGLTGTGIEVTFAPFTGNNITDGHVLYSCTKPVGNTAPGQYPIVAAGNGGSPFVVSSSGSFPSCPGGYYVQIHASIVGKSCQQPDGYVPPTPTDPSAEIGGRVYVDANLNGVDDGEVAIPGVVINLLGTNDLGAAINLTTTTGADGTYLFPNLRPGTYSIYEEQPAGYLDSPAGPATQILSKVLVDGDSDLDNDFGEIMVTTTWTAWTATQTAELPTETQTQAAETTTVELPTETQSQTQTAEPTTTLSETLTTTRSATATRTRSQTRTTTTLRPNALIAGRVYIDSNSNGVWDDGELGLSNVTLSLTGTNSRGESVNLTTTTDPSGLYAFGDLRGTTSGYTITEVQPAGFANSPLGPATVIAVPTLGESQVLLNQDFGEVAVALSGIVFVDSPTGDGIYTEDKFPVPNVTVRIFETDGNGNKVGSALATTVTDEFGQYLFAPLDPGKQYLVERDVPAGYTVPPASGWYETRLENVTNSKFLWSGNDFPLTLLQPDVNPNPMGAIGGIVYVDWSQDGVYQEGETPISGTVIRLSGNTTEGVRVSRLAITRPNGTYRFLALRPGTYTVREYQPSGTFDSLGPGTLISNIIVVGGTLDLDYNFGELVTWTRTRTRTTTQSTTSRTTSTTTFARASITGRVYFDADDNGAFTNGEQPIRSVTIQATGTNLFGVAVSTQAVTDCTGAYAFANVDAGDYTITKINPSGFKNAQNSVLQSTTTVAVRGPNSVPFQWWGLTCDSDAISSGAATNLVVSGRTFVDISPTDDIFNPVTEVGISNVVFTLTGTDVNGAAVSRTMNSYSCSSGSCGSNTFCTNSLCLDLSCGSNRINVNGMYYFNGLKPGTYTVTQTQPFGYLNGNASASSTATVVSNIDLTAACIARNNFPELGHAGYWTSSTVTTTATRTATTSFTRSSTTSFTSTSSLTRTSSSRTATATPLQDGGVTGRVWFDKNENGLWDGDPLDIPIGGVGIAITGTNYLGEQQLFFVASDPQTGWYNFTMIPPGNYRVQQTQPLGWVTAPGAVDFYNITITSGLYLSELDFLEVPEEPENANP